MEIPYSGYVRNDENYLRATYSIITSDVGIACNNNAECPTFVQFEYDSSLLNEDFAKITTSDHLAADERHPVCYDSMQQKQKRSYARTKARISTRSIEYEEYQCLDEVRCIFIHLIGI